MPAWSSDGRLLAIEIVDRNNGRPNILLLAPGEGTRQLLLPPSAEDETEFAWSPDGEPIAYTNEAGLAVVDVGTKARRQIVRADAQAPVWSPDGSMIASGTSDRVYVVKADGTGRRAVGPEFSGAAARLRGRPMAPGWRSQPRASTTSSWSWVRRAGACA